MEIIEKLRGLKSLQIVGVSGMEGGALAEFFIDQGFKNLIFHDRAKKEEFEEAYKNYHDYQSEKEKNKSIEKVLGFLGSPSASSGSLGMTQKSPPKAGSPRLSLGMTKGVKLYFGDDYLKDIEKADLVFVPSTWFRYEENEKLKDIEGKVSFSNITELYFQIMEDKKIRTIGVTGTNGKSTTTRLIYEILKNSGKDVYITGNDRDNPPILDRIQEFSQNTIVVMEIMNRQLIGLKHSPNVAVVTNITPHHLDDHPSFEDYVEVKKNVFKYQKKDDFLILNFDNEYTHEFGREGRAKTFYNSLKSEKCPGAYLRDSKIFICEDEVKIEILDTLKIKLLGRHNLENITAALLAGYIMQADRGKMKETVENFQALKHRMELVAKKGKVKYINDSESTNPASTVAALESFKENIVLIAGGRRKEAGSRDFKEMVEKFFRGNVKAVLLIGEVAPLIRNEFFIQKKRNLGIGPKEVKSFENLGEAVNTASKIAAEGEIVLLSPGAESFGEFKDYRDRGNRFKKLVKELGNC